VADPATVVEVIAAVINTSPVKAVHTRQWDIAYAVAAELRAHGLLVETDATPEAGESRG
jgi:hypothetical protein